MDINNPIADLIQIPDRDHDKLQGLSDDDHPRYGVDKGIIANRPTAGTDGRLFYATDEGLLYQDNGTTWEKVGSVPTDSLSQGDIIYYDGSKITVLSAGSAEEFLQTQGAGANPQWAQIAPRPNWKLIDSFQDTDDSSTISYSKSGIDTYHILMFKILAHFHYYEGLDLAMRVNGDTGNNYNQFSEGGSLSDGRDHWTLLSPTNKGAGVVTVEFPGVISGYNNYSGGSVVRGGSSYQSPCGGASVIGYQTTTTSINQFTIYSAHEMKAWIRVYGLNL